MTTPFLAGVGLMEIYNINATDAALLVVFQMYIREASVNSKLKFALVTSDDRLLRAAQSEGILTLNSETIDANSV